MFTKKRNCERFVQEQSTIPRTENRILKNMMAIGSKCAEWKNEPRT